jgi:hypothetical protein
MYASFSSYRIGRLATKYFLVMVGVACIFWQAENRSWSEENSAESSETSEVFRFHFDDSTEELNDFEEKQVSAFQAPASSSANASAGSRATNRNSAVRFGTSTAVARAPSRQPTYMIADTSGGGCGGLFISGSLVASIQHPTFACSRLNIAENNSPIVHDRAYVSYRHFHNASEVTVFGNTPGGGTGELNIERFTLGMERTITDDQSIEARLPINRQLNSDLYFAQFDNEQTVLPLDDYANEIGNISLIWKKRMIENDVFYASTGIAVNLPTAPAVTLRGQIDDDNFVIRDPNTGADLGLPRVPVELTMQGVIRNQTVNLSPFIAYSYTPSERWFSQGFLQVDVPLNESKADLSFDYRFSILNPPAIQVDDQLAQQTLLRLNWSLGNWFYQNDEPDSLLKALGGVVEVHYTTTLNDAKIAGPLELTQAMQIQNVAIQPIVLNVGNIANRIDVVNLVLGVPLRFERTTISNGFVVPLRESPDRGFDFEYNLLVNRKF